MALRVLQAEVLKDGKVIRPAVFEVEQVQKFSMTSAQVDLQIAQLTDRLAQLTALKAQMNPVQEVLPQDVPQG